jgi:hypothetical protein
MSEVGKWIGFRFATMRRVLCTCVGLITSQHPYLQAHSILLLDSGYAR